MHRVVPLLVALSLFQAGRVEAQSLRGSRASVDRMYSQALQHELDFFDTPSGVRNAAGRGSLVRLSGNADYRLGDVSHAYALSATRTFVQRLAGQYRQACGEQLVVTSVIRPRSQRLANSVQKSVHPTGMAVDLRKPRGTRCRDWLRRTLLDLEKQGLIEATEENRPPHFHVAVFPGPYSRHVESGRRETRLAAGSRRSARRSSGDEGREYRVRRGDSIWTIARRSNVTVEQLKAANSLRSSRIQAGQVLVIPVAR